MKHQKYNIFISYRHKTGVDDARLLQQSLKARGYNVFFDYDSVRDGKFDERIYAAIEEAPIFILLLSEGSLDTCYNEDDWVRIEIEHAMKHECKIIPVAVNPAHWVFPNNLPNSISGIVRVQISELNKAALFEESIDRIVNDRFPEPLKNVMRFKRVDIGDTHDWYDKLPVLGKIVAKLLGLVPDILIERFRQDQKLRRLKLLWYFLLPLLLLIVTAGLFMFDSTRLVTRYYADYVDSFGLPEGIYELSDDEIAGGNVHYRFEFRGYQYGSSPHADSAGPSWFGFRRRLVRVVQASSSGFPRKINHTEYAQRPMIQDFEYDKDGRLTKIFFGRFNFVFYFCTAQTS